MTETPPAPSTRPASPDPDAPPRPPFADLLDQRTLDARTVLVFGPVTEALAADVVRRLIALDAAGDAPIDVIVSSPGGHVESGDAIHDMIRFVRFVWSPSRILCDSPKRTAPTESSSRLSARPKVLLGKTPAATPH